MSLAETITQSFSMAFRGVLKIRLSRTALRRHVPADHLHLLFTYVFGGAISGDVKSYLPVIIPHHGADGDPHLDRHRHPVARGHGQRRLLTGSGRCRSPDQPAPAGALLADVIRFSSRRS